MSVLMVLWSKGACFVGDCMAMRRPVCSGGGCSMEISLRCVRVVYLCLALCLRMLVRESTRGGGAKMSWQPPDEETDADPGILGFQRRVLSAAERERLRLEAMLHDQ